MFDIGWPELLVVAIVLIIVVGPKDLPKMLRAFGRTTKKFREMANDFRGQFDEALREAELDDVRKTISDARSLNPMNQIREAVNPLKQTGEQIRRDLEKTVNTDKPVAIPDPGMKLEGGPPKIDAPNADRAVEAAPAKGPVATPEARVEAKSKSKSAKSPAGGKAKAKPVDKPAAPKARASAPAKTGATTKTAAAKRTKTTENKAAGKTAAKTKAASTARKPASRKPKDPS